jgi:hypothetical protein
LETLGSGATLQISAALIWIRSGECIHADLLEIAIVTNGFWMYVQLRIAEVRSIQVDFPCSAVFSDECCGVCLWLYWSARACPLSGLALGGFGAGSSRAGAGAFGAWGVGFERPPFVTYLLYPFDILHNPNTQTHLASSFWQRENRNTFLGESRRSQLTTECNFWATSSKQASEVEVRNRACRCRRTLSGCTRFVAPARRPLDPPTHP